MRKIKLISLVLISISANFLIEIPCKAKNFFIEKSSNVLINAVMPKYSPVFYSASPVSYYQKFTKTIKRFNENSDNVLNADHNSERPASSDYRGGWYEH